MPKTPTNKKPSRVQGYLSNIIAKKKRSKAPKKRNHDATKDVAMDDMESENAALQPEDVDVGKVVLPIHINDGDDDNETTRAGKRSELVRGIMHKVISKNSVNRYSATTADFMMHLYDDDALRNVMLEDWFVMELDNIKASETNSKRQYAKMKQHAKEKVIECDEYLDNCPLKLDMLAFEDIAEYLANRRGVKGKNKGRRLANGSYEIIVSGIKHLYRSSKYTYSNDIATKMNQFMAGMKRDVTDEKVELGGGSSEGKKRMTFEVYQLLCELFMREEDPEFAFAHAFLTLEWNLMARSENVVDAHVDHIFWNNDSLVMQFARTKGDQIGKKSDQLWHVYANPDNPAVCAVLALSKYLFSFPGILSVALSSDEGKIFPGNAQYDRFMKCFKKVIAENEDEFKRFGVGIGDLGSHSARKGACSFASAGCTVSPPMVSICLRAMWSMG